MLKELSVLPPETLKAIYLNSNTQFITYREVSPGYIDSVITPRVRNRILLNQLGLNGLATTIVENPKPEMFSGNNFFRRIINYSNWVNESLDLPSTGDLVIRTSAANTLRDHRVRISEPAVLVTNAGSLASRFSILSGDKSRAPHLHQRNFFSFLGSPAFLMIHDDNNRLQRQAMHGRISQTPDRDEIVIATGTTHSRGLSEKNPDYPYITLRMYGLGHLERINPDLISAHVSLGQTRTEGFGIEYSVHNCSQHEAYALLFKLLREQFMIRNVLSICNKHFGQYCVMEFRSYNLIEGGIGRKIHVLDVN